MNMSVHVNENGNKNKREINYTERKCGSKSLPAFIAVVEVVEPGPSILDDEISDGVGDVGQD